MVLTTALQRRRKLCFTSTTNLNEKFLPQEKKKNVSNENNFAISSLFLVGC